METIRINDIEIEIEHKLTGSMVDEQGFVQPTYNWTVITGYELDENGERTGNAAFAAQNNGTVSETTIVPGGTPSESALCAWLDCWDSPHLDDMKSEGVYPEN